MNYPIIYYPSQFRCLWEKSILYPEKPTKPIPPKEPEHLIVNSCLENLALSAVTLFVIPGGCIFFGNLGTGKSADILIGAILFFGSIFLLVLLINSEESIKKKNDLLTENYQKIMQTYSNITLLQYKNELSLYNKKIELLKNKEFQSQLARKLFYQALFDAPIPIETAPETHRGSSEIRFYKLLKLKFPEKIFINHSIDFSINFNRYRPDIIFYDETSGLCIDIEIDEPYVAKTGQPIHYIGSEDNLRNDFFTAQNWVVIRFAEEQIIKQPLSCIRVVAEVILELGFDLKKELLSVKKIKPIKQWNYEEASLMAFSRHRNNYISMAPSTLKRNK